MRLEKQLNFLIEEIQWHSNAISEHIKTPETDLADRLDLQLSVTYMEKEIENLSRCLARIKEKYSILESKIAM